MTRLFRGSSAAMGYGFLLGLASFVLTQVVSQPAGTIAFWVVLLIQDIALSWVVWKRLGLTSFVVLGLTNALGVVIILRFAFNGQHVPDMPIDWLVLLCCLFLLNPAVIGLESLRNSREWQAWRAATDRMSLWDLLTFRHIPDLGAGRG